MPQGHSLYALGGAGPALYAAGEFGTVLRSDDAGGSWTGLPSGTTASLRQVDVLDADSLVVGGGCTLRRSDDGGRRFTRLPFTSSDRRCASDVAAFDFVAGGNGYIALQNGTLLQTPDGGNTFSQRSAVPGTSAGGGPSTPSALAFTEPQTGVAITGNGPGAIYRTTNGASSWTQVAPSGPALAGLHFPPRSAMPRAATTRFCAASTGAPRGSEGRWPGRPGARRSRPCAARDRMSA